MSSLKPPDTDPAFNVDSIITTTSPIPCRFFVHSRVALSRTQERVRHILAPNTHGRGGLPGNDDSGAMSCGTYG